MPPRLFSYILKVNNGFAPCIIGGICSLACCKPAIRRVASINDWVVGLSPRKDGNTIIYAMQVEEKIPFTEYWTRYPKRRPMGKKLALGDNVYPNYSSGPIANAHHDKTNKDHDLSGRYVLISKNKTYYFGNGGLTLPHHLTGLICTQGHRSTSNQPLLPDFLALLDKQQRFTGTLSPTIPDCSTSCPTPVPKHNKCRC